MDDEKEALLAEHHTEPELKMAGDPGDKMESAPGAKGILQVPCPGALRPQPAQSLARPGGANVEVTW